MLLQKRRIVLFDTSSFWGISTKVSGLSSHLPLPTTCLDYFVFPYLKNNVFKNRPGTIPELMQVITDNCNLIDIPGPDFAKVIWKHEPKNNVMFRTFSVVLVRIRLELLLYDALAQCLSNEDNLHPRNNICLLISLINFIFTKIRSYCSHLRRSVVSFWLQKETIEKSPQKHNPFVNNRGARDPYQRTQNGAVGAHRWIKAREF
jgi:hypothetical protein